MNDKTYNKGNYIIATWLQKATDFKITDRTFQSWYNLFAQTLPSTTPKSDSTSYCPNISRRYRKVVIMHLVLYLIGENLTTKPSSILYVNTNGGLLTLDPSYSEDAIKELNLAVTRLWTMVGPSEINDRDSNYSWC